MKGGGNSRVKAYGDVPPQWDTFSPKILRNGSHFGQNILRRVLFHKTCKKLVKSAVFEVEKPLKWVTIRTNLTKKQKTKTKTRTVQSTIFEGEKSSDMERILDFVAAHPIKK